MAEATLHAWHAPSFIQNAGITSNTILISFKDVLMSTVFFFFFLREKMASYFYLFSLSTSNI